MAIIQLLLSPCYSHKVNKLNYRGNEYATKHPIDGETVSSINMLLVSMAQIIKYSLQNGMHPDMNNVNKNKIMSLGFLTVFKCKINRPNLSLRLFDCVITSLSSQQVFISTTKQRLELV